VDYDHHATPQRMEIDVSTTGDLDPERLARLEKVAAGCPLRKALHTDVEFEERSPGGRPAHTLSPSGA